MLVGILETGVGKRYTEPMIKGKGNQGEGQEKTGAVASGLFGLSFSGLSLSFFGFAFSRAANDIAGYRLADFSVFGSLSSDDVFSVSMMMVFLLFAVIARKIAPLYNKSWAVWSAAGAAVFSAFVLWFAEMSISPTLGLIAMVLSGFSSAVFILLWAEFHSCLDPARIVLYVSGAFLFGSVAAWLLRDLDSLRLLMVLCLLPFLSVACLRASFPQIEAPDLPKKTWGKYKFPWKLIFVLGVYELVFGIREASPSFSFEAYDLGTIGITLFVFVIALFFSKRIDFSFVYQTPFVLMVGGLAMIPVAASVGSFASDLLISAGYALMFLVLTLLLCSLSHRFGVSVLILCGVQELAAGFRIIGHQVPVALEYSSVNDTVLPVVLTAAVIVASLALLHKGKNSTDWGASFFGVGKMAGDLGPQERLAQQVRDVAGAHGLSPRETEVLGLLAKGKSPSSIERELFIANGTLKSHTRRIYQKLGINSKAELQAMFEGEEN